MYPSNYNDGHIKYTAINIQQQTLDKTNLYAEPANM